MSLPGSGQITNLLGVNINGEVYPEGFRPSPGISFETQLRKHSGAETGIYYRTALTKGVVTYSDSVGPARPYGFTVARRYVHIPVLYKFYSKVLNFSVGPTFDLFTGWKQKRDELPAHIQSFKESPKFKVGFLCKVGKAISASTRIIVEPELRYASIQGFEGGGVGVGLAVKYNFFDLH
jgi:hypothetical protein